MTTENVETPELEKWPRRRVHKEFNGISLTEQHHKDDCDMHFIMRKFEKTGQIEHLNTIKPVYADLLAQPSFEQQVNSIAQMTEAFNTAPAKVRERFGNNPGEWLEWLSNPDNRKEIEDYGYDASHLPVRETPAEPVATPAAPEAPPPEPNPETPTG